LLLLILLLLLLLVEFKECNRPMVIQKTILYQQNHSSQ
jgi:hypothetical protein